MTLPFKDAEPILLPVLRIDYGEQSLTDRSHIARAGPKNATMRLSGPAVDLQRRVALVFAHPAAKRVRMPVGCRIPLSFDLIPVFSDKRAVCSLDIVDGKLLVGRLVLHRLLPGRFKPSVRYAVNNIVPDGQFNLKLRLLEEGPAEAALRLLNQSDHRRYSLR